MKFRWCPGSGEQQFQTAFQKRQQPTNQPLPWPMSFHASDNSKPEREGNTQCCVASGSEGQRAQQKEGLREKQCERGTTAGAFWALLCCSPWMFVQHFAASAAQILTEQFRAGEQRTQYDDPYCSMLHVAASWSQRSQRSSGAVEQCCVLPPKAIISDSDFSANKGPPEAIIRVEGFVSIRNCSRHSAKCSR